MSDHRKIVLDLTTVHPCDERGCERDGMECYLPEYDRPEGHRDEPDGYYCGEHAFKNGFCWRCGGFFAGIESFEFLNRNHLCDNCQSEIEDDEYEDDGFAWAEWEAES